LGGITTIPAAAYVLEPVSVRAFGARGDDTQNDRPYLQAAMDFASATKRPLVIEPGTYQVSGGTSEFACLKPASDLTVYGHGATLKNVDAGVRKGTIQMLDVSNINFYGLTIDGNKAAFPSVETEQKHGIWIMSSRNVCLEDCYSKNNKGDGVVISPHPETRTQSENVVMHRVVCDTNHRQGMTIAGLRSGAFYGCRFINTSGTSPQAGVDHEPNFDWSNTENIRYYGCEFSGNAGPGLAIGTSYGRVSATGGSRFITFHGCQFEYNGEGGAFIQAVRNIRFRGCTLANNTGPGLHSANDVTEDVLISDSLIRDNDQYGVFMKAGENQYIRRIYLSNVTITGNGRVLVPAYYRSAIFLYSPNTGGVIDDVYIRGCTIGNVPGDSTTAYGVVTENDDVGTISNLRLVGNNFRKNATAATDIN
jgi:hypothetical protein